ncbi:putative DNA-binding transcriptional regulator YafY [Microbacterium halimionae]|uniref:Putative DNA-binding transcriptional regulator YafY n=1 Tax=Microbacterium halimionae TaxID=1526413 RepID=A0A7W3JMI2_9MICO|nr:WYL domain-containing protein [Microbacterium halimionae]MBA8815575.1 putative DNA-binding transcriptional regulator YafY [Microbacterium halimionae]NII95621.1 putative DNA-binding transcriptional regulator YafY [Microbacterium halimionae]
MTTTERLLNLLSLLQTRRDWPGSLLATRLDVSDRTVRRDIDRLREMGYSIQATMGPDGGYRLDAGSELPPLLLDDDQALAVAIALRAAPAIGAGIEEAAIRALGTMRQVMPARLRYRLDALEITTIGRAGDATPGDVSLDVLVALAQTIRDRQVLRFDYTPRVAAQSEVGEPLQARRVEPHHLVTSHGRWYLVGWDLDREDWRIYSVDRIHTRMPHGARFTPRAVPGGDVNDFVSARFKGSDVNEWACRGTVLLHLPARDVLPFAGDGTVTAIDDQTCTLEGGSWSWGSLAASYGRFEVPMEVIDPPELATAFAILSERYSATSANSLPRD